LYIGNSKNLTTHLNQFGRRWCNRF
jgi:hypothetical protein